MQDIRDPVQDELAAVNDVIIANLASDVGLVENIGHYIVDAGGKRLRPLLALLAAKCCGYEGEDHVKFAAVVEFIHTATLLHDDVVDISALRRGRPTANAEFGNAPSVLVGDFLSDSISDPLVLRIWAFTAVGRKSNKILTRDRDLPTLGGAHHCFPNTSECVQGVFGLHSLGIHRDHLILRQPRIR